MSLLSFVNDFIVFAIVVSVIYNVSVNDRRSQ